METSMSGKETGGGCRTPFDAAPGTGQTGDKVPQTSAFGPQWNPRPLFSPIPTGTPQAENNTPRIDISHRAGDRVTT